ncbi:MULTISPECIES: thioesterase II family protein [Sphingobacterium]|uniref:thioesterase II family protein n=1 Tax=Sphingobacterium TaxID=28453 RepID=UPI000B496264|nr:MULTISPECIES: alpha/beta fold hydrolase [Sphingobacterium]
MAQIFLIHFAGGSFYSFDFLKPYLTNHEFIPIELPGRGKRIKEQLITDFSLAATDLCKQVEKHVEGKDFIIYGHSMGAYLSLKVASILETKGLKPKSIIVSGNIGPVKKDSNKFRHLLSDQELLLELKEIGSESASHFTNKEYREFFLPILRSDFQVAEKNNPSDFDVVSIPIIALMGNKEHFNEKIDNWKSYTSSEFSWHIMQGGHFFIYNAAKEIAKLMNTILLPSIA